MKWYKRDPHRWYEGTREVPLDARGFYGDCIDIYIARDGDLPNDDRWLARAIACDIRTARRLKAWLIAHGKIAPSDDGRLVPNGCDATLLEAKGFQTNQTNRAKKRWKNNKPPNAKTTNIEEEEEKLSKSFSSSSSDSEEKNSRPTNARSPDFHWPSDEELAQWQDQHHKK